MTTARAARTLTAALLAFPPANTGNPWERREMFVVEKGFLHGYRKLQ